MNITANAASLSWRTNNKGVWKALVKDMAPDSSVTFSTGLTGTVAGRQVTVESPSMPTGFMTYTTDDNTAVYGGVLYGAGTAYDSLEAVGGEKTVRMGSVDLGTLDWTISGTLFRSNNIPADIKPSGDNNVPANAITAKYRNVSWITMGSSTVDKQMGIIGAGGSIAIRDNSFTDPVEFKASLSGVMLYYELATPTTSTETAQSMSLAQGSDTIGGGSFSATYEGTEYEIQLVKGCKYIHRDEAGVDTLLSPTAYSTVNVIGQVTKLINLTHWFGAGNEPTISTFYKLYPTWKTYDIPYMVGTIVNYKGTGVQTIGFNAYNHATGTAELLGGNKYQICGTYTSVSYIDQWGETEELELDSDGIFTPTNNGTLTVVGGNATDTCVHLCWSGYKNFGEREYQWEPFVKNVHGIDVARYFPYGMNGIGSNGDELTSTSSTQRYGVMVFDGTENWSNNAGPMGLTISDMKTGYIMTNAWCSHCMVYNSSRTAAFSIIFGLHNKSITFQGVSNYPVPNNVAAWKAWLAQQYEVGTPMVIVYPLETLIVTQLPSPINLTYPVNDFGTEQSLPVNTTDLVTTDLHALIRYNTDYMRMNTQLSEIFPTVRSLAQQEQDGEIMKTDATAPNATVGNAYNLIDRNAAGTERQFSFDSSGGTQDIADGTAVAKKLMGTTLNLNQLVHDTNENTVESVDGNATVADAVEGQVKHLVVSGDTVVVNQLVHEYIEKTESGTGRIWIKDAFEKEAKGLKVIAPRSVVMNQLSQSTVSSYWEKTGNVSKTFDDDVFTLTSSTDSVASKSARYGIASVFVPGHVYAIYAELKTDGTSHPHFGIRTNDYGINTWYLTTNAISTEISDWQKCSAVGAVTNSSTGKALVIALDNTDGTGASAQFRNMMCVDLTQYFNGNTTLINSITSWDDLVAYDSAFASYVTYNTGTVKGVTPALTLNGAAQPFATAPQEMFGVGTVGDEYSVVDGKYTTKVGKLDIGTLDWSMVSNGLFRVNNLTGIQGGGDNNTAANTCCTIYTASSWNDAINNVKDMVVGVAGAGSSMVIRNNAYTDATTFTNAMSGVMLYYELATPVVTDVTPVSFDLVSHDNTIFQTSGDLQAGIEATYDGLNQTIALDPAHTYAFNHQYIEDSIITGESSIDCVGTEDNLVDLTQLYAGDATRIAAIHSWASLSSRIHMYRDWLPYNPGEIVNLSATIRVYQHEHAYGVVYDPSQSSPACQRVELNDGVITEVEEFTSLPAHDFKRCVMDDLATRHVNYYLDPLDSTKKADGTPSVLTGADGDVMVEIPITHWSLDEDYNGEGKVLWLVSDAPFTGSEIHPYFYVSPNGDEPRTQYVGAYRASLCDGNGLPLNTTEGSANISLGNTATNICRSIAGAPYSVGFDMATYRTWFARNGASMVNYWFNSYLYLMMVVETGTLDTQTISLGYTGGLAQSAWCFRLSGRVNYGNGTGELLAVPGTNDEDVFYALRISNIYGLYKDTDYDANGYYAWSNHPGPGIGVLRFWTASSYPNVGDAVYSDAEGTLTDGQVTSRSSLTPDGQRVIQFQYRGIENPFGEMWTYEDGLQRYQCQAQDSLVVNGVVHYRDYLKNGSGTKTAWTSEDGTSTFWTVNRSPGNAQIAYTDSECTQDSGLKTTLSTYVYHTSEAWVTSATDDYTSIGQHGIQTPVYSLYRHGWPGNSGDMKTFDPRTFFARTIIRNISYNTYSCDYFINNGFNRHNLSIHGGRLSYNKPAGQGCRSVENTLNQSTWGSRPSC